MLFAFLSIFFPQIDIWLSCLLIHNNIYLLSGFAEDILPKAWRPGTSTTIDRADVCFKYSLLKYFERKHFSDQKYSLSKLLIWQADTCVQYAMRSMKSGVRKYKLRFGRKLRQKML